MHRLRSLMRRVVVVFVAAAAVGITVAVAGDAATAAGWKIRRELINV